MPNRINLSQNDVLCGVMASKVEKLFLKMLSVSTSIRCSGLRIVFSGFLMLDALHDGLLGWLHGGPLARANELAEEKEQALGEINGFWRVP